MKKEIVIGSSLIFIIDQISKYLMERFFKNKVLVIIPNLFNIDFTYNRGGAFSILNDQIILLIVATIVCLFVLVKISKEVEPSIPKTFNVADMAIVLGMFLLIIELLRKSEKHAKDNC